MDRREAGEELYRNMFTRGGADYMKKAIEIDPEPEKDFITTVKSGDRLKSLISLRNLLAERLQNAGSSRDIASISRRLMQCIEEIDALQQKKTADESSRSLDEIRNRFIKYMEGR